MSEALVFAKRNIKRYFRDAGVMLFSLLSVFIVAALYMLFLTDMQVDSIKAAAGDLPGIENMVVSWVVGGLLCIPAISVPQMILSFKVDDLADGRQDDLFVTPAKRSSIMFGYVISAWAVGFVMTLLTLVLCEGFIVTKGGELLTITEMLKAVGFLSLLIFTFSGLSFFIALFLKSKSAVMVVVSVLNTLLGFLLGLFVPVGMLSSHVATSIKLLPTLQGASLLRRIFMRDALDQISAAAGPAAVADIKDIYGVDITIGDHLMKTFDIIMILVIVSVIFYGGCAVIINRMKRK